VTFLKQLRTVTGFTDNEIRTIDSTIEMLLLHDEIYAALKESLKFQSHYANLLNMYDGGERRQFLLAEDWIARLREVKE
jgi:sulfur transfer complex TusBCD TusB component (DsrH family)